MTATEKKAQRGESRRRSAVLSPVVRPRAPRVSISAVSSPGGEAVFGSVRSGTRNYRPADGGLASGAVNCRLRPVDPAGDRGGAEGRG